MRGRSLLTATFLLIGSIGETGQAQQAAPSAEFSVSEDAPPGTIVGRIRIGTDDQPPSLADFEFRDMDGSSPFRIDPDSGELRLQASPLDYESRNRYDVSVRIRSARPLDAARRSFLADLLATGAGPEAVEQILFDVEVRPVVIHVTDAPEPPVLAPQSLVIVVEEGSNEAHAAIVAHDPDHNDPPTFELIAGAAELFRIDPQTGLLTWLGRASESATVTYPLTVRVIDSTGLSDAATINVEVVTAAPRIAWDDPKQSPVAHEARDDEPLLAENHPADAADEVALPEPATARQPGIVAPSPPAEQHSAMLESPQQAVTTSDAAIPVTGTGTRFPWSIATGIVALIAAAVVFIVRRRRAASSAIDPWHGPAANPLSRSAVAAVSHPSLVGTPPLTASAARLGRPAAAELHDPEKAEVQALIAAAFRQSGQQPAERKDAVTADARPDSSPVAEQMTLSATLSALTPVAETHRATSAAAILDAAGESTGALPPETQSDPSLSAVSAAQETTERDAAPGTAFDAEEDLSPLPDAEAVETTPQALEWSTAVRQQYGEYDGGGDYLGGAGYASTPDELDAEYAAPRESEYREDEASPGDSFHDEEPAAASVTVDASAADGSAEASADCDERIVELRRQLSDLFGVALGARSAASAPASEESIASEAEVAEAPVDDAPSAVHESEVAVVDTAAADAPGAGDGASDPSDPVRSWLEYVKNRALDKPTPAAAAAHNLPPHSAPPAGASLPMTMPAVPPMLTEGPGSAAGRSAPTAASAHPRMNKTLVREEISFLRDVANRHTRSVLAQRAWRQRARLAWILWGTVLVLLCFFGQTAVQHDSALIRLVGWVLFAGAAIALAGCLQGFLKLSTSPAHGEAVPAACEGPEADPSHARQEMERMTPEMEARLQSVMLPDEELAAIITGRDDR